MPRSTSPLRRWKDPDEIAALAWPYSRFHTRYPARTRNAFYQARRTHGVRPLDPQWRRRRAVLASQGRQQPAGPSAEEVAAALAFTPGRDLRIGPTTLNVLWRAIRQEQQQ